MSQWILSVTVNVAVSTYGSLPNSNPSSNPNPNSNPSSNPNPNPNLTPENNPENKQPTASTATSSRDMRADSSRVAQDSGSNTSGADTDLTSQDAFPWWIVVPILLLVVFGAAVCWHNKRRDRNKS